MKTKHLQLLLLAGFIFPLLSVAQTTPYRSYFGKEFTHWYTFHEFYDIGYSNLYFLGKEDTIFSPNNITYKKLYEYDYCYYYIREEPETGSLFIKPALDSVFIYKNGDSEILVSQMNLEIGDKFYFSPDFPMYDLYYFEGMRTDETGSYTVVDSIYYEDNRKYIRFEAIYNALFNVMPLTFIEGIGPNVSFEPIMGINNWENIGFTCYETENELWKAINLPKGDNGACLFNWSGIPKIKTDFPLKLIQRNGEIELQPDAGSFNSGWVYMYSMQGQLLYAKPAQGNANIIIPTSGFSKGAYIVRVIDEKTQKSRSVKVNI